MQKPALRKILAEMLQRYGNPNEAFEVAIREFNQQWETIVKQHVKNVCDTTEANIRICIQLQTDLLTMETDKLSHLVANKKQLIPFDFSRITEIRNSIVFLNGCLPNNLFPADCKIAINPDGSMYPVKQ